jgi:predicted nucleic acid-binding protein
LSQQPVFVNAGPLIALGKLNRLGLLASLYPHVQIPSTVYREVVIEGAARSMTDALHVRLFVEHHGIQIVRGSDVELESYQPGVVLDPGEQELLAMARSISGALVLLDDETARTEARRLGLAVKGTLGVLVQAYRAGLLGQRETDFLLVEIAERPDIWISSELCNQIRQSL